MLYGEKMKEICEKLGVNVSTLSDNLYSTLLNEICDCCDSGGGSGITATVSGEAIAGESDEVTAVVSALPTVTATVTGEIV